MTRILLSLIFCFFLLLVAIEYSITLIIRKFFSVFSLFKKKLRKKRKKTFVLPFRSKIKYFAFGIFFACLFLFPPLVIMVFLTDLPTPQELTLRQIPQTTKIFDRNGILLSEVYAQQNRTLIALDDVPQPLQQATLAIEDKNFYKHPGFDLSAIMRAVQQTVLHKNTQGGSTITQQLIKSSILTPEQSISRKLKELVLAFWTERIYTKDQILEMYFNQVPYGGTAWGAEAAAETYFNTSVKDLDLAESAFLAGLTSAPTFYSPYGMHPTAWKARQKDVLKRMVDLQYISQKQADEANSETLHFRKPQTALHAPHFVASIKDLLIQKYGLPTVEKGGLQVRTTLDLAIQEMAEKIVAEEVANAASLNLSNGAALITDPKNGDILAMVGSHDFNDPVSGNVNIVTSFRQPGSSIKVVTYSAALAHGFTAGTMLDDSPISYPLTDGQVYTPVNYDGRYRGRVSLRFALSNSLNIPAIKTLDAIGIPTMVTLGKHMGIESWGDPKDYGLSLTLGAAEVTMLDMARVNGTLANNGQLVPLNPITKITDVKGNTLEEKQTPKGKQILNRGIAFIIADILSDTQTRTAAFGINSVLEIPGHRVSVKTGTTDNKRDNWTNGYTNNYVVIVWVGNNDNTPMSPTLASGITGAAPIWHRIMEQLLNKHAETKPTIPEEVVQKTCFGKPEYFLKGTETTVACGSPSPSSSFSNLQQSPTSVPKRRRK